MVSFNKYLNVGDKIHIKAVDKKNSNVYISKVADIYDDIIEMFFPIYQKNTIYFLDGERLEIVICKNEAVFQLLAIVSGKNFGNVPVIKLQIISELKKIQRRNFYRLKIVKPIKYRIITLLDNETQIIKYYEGILLDISEGGIMFCSKKEMESNDLLEMEIALDTKNILLKGVIVRKQYNTEKSLLYEYGVKFKDITKADKDLLMKFIFKEQRKLLKKGLI